MSQLYNIYAEQLETAFIQLIRQWMMARVDFAPVLSIVNQVGEGYGFAPIEDGDPNIETPAELQKNKPMISIATESSVEAVYQSGIYSNTLEFTTVVDLDTGGPQQARVLFTALLDCLQQPSLVSQLNAMTDDNGNALVVVRGVVIGQQRLSQQNERDWLKTVSMEVFGFSPNPTEVLNAGG